MGAVGGVAILGGNFEAATFPEDKVVQRSLTVGNQEVVDIDAVILDALPLGAPGQLDSHAMLWKGHSNDGSPHTIDWKAFVNVTADDGTGSLWTLQTRIDGAPYTDILTVDDNGLLTVSGATFTMDQLIIDTDNAEAIIVRKDGDAGDVFIVDTINDGVRMASDATFLTFGASSDVRLERAAARTLQINSVPGIADSGDNELRIIAIDDGVSDRWLELFSGTSAEIARVRARRALGGASFHLDLVTDSGSMRFFTDGVQRWTILTTAGGDSEFEPFITNRYDIGRAAGNAVRDVFTNRVFIGQDQVAAYDAITIDGTDLAAPGQQDSGAIILTGLSNDGSAHDIDWKQFVNVTANAGTGSIWTLQARIDAASFVDEFTITATTSPTLAHIGPGSTDGALAFGPIGAAGPAQSGTLRFRNTDDIRWRNSGDDDDNVYLSIGISDELILGENTTGPYVGVVPELRCLEQLNVTHDSSGAFNVSGTGFSPVVFNVGTAGADMLVTIGSGVALLASVEERLILRGPNLTVNSTVGFSHALLLQGQARTGAGVVHDANWRMYVEPLTTTAFDGQSVFKITAEIDTGGPTTVFTLSDTGDLIVPGSFTIDGLIIDVTSTEAFLVRKNADGGDVFNIDTSNSLVQLRGGAALEIGTIPASTGSIRLSNTDSIFMRNHNDNGDISILVSPMSSEFLMFDATVPRVTFQQSRTTFNQEVQVALAHSVTNAFQVGGDLNVDTSNNRVTVNNALIVGATLPAQSGTIRLPNAGDIVWRNSGNSGDNILLSVGSSDEMILGESTTGPFIRVVPELRCFDRLTVQHTATNAVSFAQDNGANPAFVVDTTNEMVRLASDATILAFGASSDAQMHRDAADIIAQRRGANTQEWRLYDNFVSSIDYDRLAIYIGGGPPIITAEIAAQSTDGAQQINMELSTVGSPSSMFFTNGTAIMELAMGFPRINFTPSDSWDIGQLTGSRPRDMSLSRRLDVGFNATTPVLDSIRMFVQPPAGTGVRDSHGIEWVAQSRDGGPHNIDWQAFVDSINNDGTGTRWTLQNRIDGAGFATKFFVEDSSAILGLPQDVASIQIGAALDAQIHRGDAADIWEQRRGANPQEWRLYDRFVSHSDYDRLAIYIGGGPPLKTIEFVAESTNASQGISIDIEARSGSSADGRLNLMVGSALLQMSVGQATLNTPFSITSSFSNSLNLSGFMILGSQETTAGVGIKIDIGGQGAAAFEDSHSIDLIGAGENNNRATWRTFVDVIDVTANSIWTLQDDKNGGGFITNFSITDDGGFNFPHNLPSHAIGLAIDTQNQLTLGGDYFALAGANLVGTRFKIQDRVTNATGNITGFFAMNIAANMRTQSVEEDIADIAQLNLEEPAITDILPGAGVITRASTLRIGGAPTEGVNNFALLIEDGLAKIGQSSSSGLKLLISGASAFPNQFDDNAQVRISSIFVSDGSQDFTTLLHVDSRLIGANGDTDHISGVYFNASLQTQAATEDVTDMSQLRLDAPVLTTNLSGSIINAQTVFIEGEPTGAVSTNRYALRVGGGDVQISNSSAFLMRRTSAADMNIFSSPQSDELTFGDANMPIILIPANVRMTKQLEVRFGSTASFFVSTGAGVAVFQVNTTAKEVDVIGDAFKFIADTSVAGSNNLEIRQARTSVSTASGSSVTAAGLIPAGSFVIGVNVRVLTPVTGPAGFDVGDGIDVDRWGNSIAVAGSTTTDITDYTSGAVTTFQVANDVVITSDGVDFTGGTIRIVVNYMTLTGPIN